MKLTGDARIAADRLYRSAHVQKLFQADSGTDFDRWIADRMEAAQPILAKAHDVRHIGKCRFCGMIGDYRRMIRVQYAISHGLCAIASAGIDAVASLPDEAGKISLDEIGLSGMRMLCDRIEGKQPAALTFD